MSINGSWQSMAEQWPAVVAMAGILLGLALLGTGLARFGRHR